MNTSRAVRALAVSAFLAMGSVASSAQADGEPTAPASSSPAPAASASTTEPPPAAVKHTAWPWIVMGTGIALVATATVIEIIAVHEDDKRQLDEEKLTATTDPAAKKDLQDSRDAHDQSAKNGRTSGLIIGSVGFVAIAGAVVWWFLEGGYGPSDPAAAPASAKETRKPTFMPSFAPGYAGASLSASF